MRRSCYNITLDIHSGHSNCLPEMKQSDTHRRLYFRLTDGGRPYRLDPDCYAVFTAKKPDGTVIYNRCAIEDGAILYDVTPQTTAVPGLLSCELRLLAYDTPPVPAADGTLPESGARVLVSATFGIQIHPCVYNENETLASASEVSALSCLVAEAHQTVEDLKAARDAGEFDGQSVTHQWEGTVLTVTSAAGTSRADLQGPRGLTGEKGEKGEKGDPGSLELGDDSVGEKPWSSRNIADRLCPAFTSSGLLVHCRPLKDYPLTVSFESDGQTPEVALTVLGKNLYDRSKYPLRFEGYAYRSSGKFSQSNTFRRTDYIPVGHLAGQTVTLNYAPVESNFPGMVFYDENKTYLSGGAGDNITVPEGAAYMVFSVAADNVQKDIQLELGSRSTAYEPYWEQVHLCADDYTTANRQVPGISGAEGDMIFFAKKETGFARVEVSGVWDIKDLLTALTEAVYQLQRTQTVS